MAFLETFLTTDVIDVFIVSKFEEKKYICMTIYRYLPNLVLSVYTWFLSLLAVVSAFLTRKSLFLFLSQNIDILRIKNYIILNRRDVRWFRYVYIHMHNHYHLHYRCTKSYFSWHLQIISLKLRDKGKKKEGVV